MGRFVSREELLFTHKPLATQNNCAPAESYQNLINGLFKNPETLDITRVSDFFDLLPLDGAGGFGGYIVNYAVYVFYLVCDTI